MSIILFIVLVINGSKTKNLTMCLKYGVLKFESSNLNDYSKLELRTRVRSASIEVSTLVSLVFVMTQVQVEQVGVNLVQVSTHPVVFLSSLLTAFLALTALEVTVVVHSILTPMLKVLSTGKGRRAMLSATSHGSVVLQTLHMAWILRTVIVGSMFRLVVCTGGMEGLTINVKVLGVI